MKQIKICIIGGGSYQWAPVLINDFGLDTEFEGELWLFDIAPEPLSITYEAGQVILRAHESSLKLRKTTSREEALSDADFVVLTITTGGIKAMEKDIEIPKRYGVWHSVGDTTGPAGLSRTLRNVPVMIEICRDMERFCPTAWMFNLSNPMATFCSAANRYSSIRTIGLCHELYYTLKDISVITGIPQSDFDVTLAGVNHFAWILRLQAHGADGFELLRQAVADIDSAPDDAASEEMKLRKERLKYNRLKLALLDAYDALPAAGDRHLAEFFPNFLVDAQSCATKYAFTLADIEGRRKWMQKWKQYNLDLISGKESVPSEHSPETVSVLTKALTGHQSEIDVVDIPNRGQIQNLPYGAIVETMGIVGPYEVTGVCSGSLPEALRTIIERHVVNEEMSVTAAVDGNRKLALQVLLNEPLTCRFEDAPKLLGELLNANREYLPQFNRQ